MTASDTILRRQEGAVVIITLNRPTRANAYTDAMLVRLAGLLDELAQLNDVGALVITGAGTHFCAGADLDEIRNRKSRDAFSIPAMALFDKVEAFPRPVVAAINGAAMAGGLEFALACDLRIASPQARFALPETALGIIPAAGGTWRLPRVVGPALAREIILFGRNLDAPEALACGLVSEVVLKESMVDKAVIRAAEAAGRHRLAQSLAKEALNRSLCGETGTEVVKQAQSRLYGRDRAGGSDE